MKYILINTLIALIITFNTLAQNYQPPGGIPVPEFGLSEEAPAWPSSWPSNEVVNYYYIDNTHPNATNASNTYGSPDRPRTSIPEITYPAGSYVEIHAGLYLGGGQIIFTGNGTETEPVWIRGVSSSDKGDISGEMIVKGSYGIIENFVFSTDYAVVGVGPHNGSTAHHIAIRNNEMFGTGTDVSFRFHDFADAALVIHNMVLIWFSATLLSKGGFI